MSTVILIRGSSGGRSSSTSRSSYSSPTRKSTSSTKNSSSSSSSTKSYTSKPKATPGSSITAGGKTIKTSSKKPTNSKYTNESGIVGDNGYTPRFTNGYNPPYGTVVYYPSHSMWDYLPWIYLFSQQSPSRDQATMVQPDGKEVTAQPENGFDGLALLNWIIIIAMIAAFIWAIVWTFNNKDKIKESFNSKKKGQVWR